MTSWPSGRCLIAGLLAVGCSRFAQQPTASPRSPSQSPACPGVQAPMSLPDPGRTIQNRSQRNQRRSRLARHHRGFGMDQQPRHQHGVPHGSEDRQSAGRGAGQQTVLRVRGGRRHVVVAELRRARHLSHRSEDQRGGGEGSRRPGKYRRRHRLRRWLRLDAQRSARALFRASIPPPTK